MKEKDGAGGLEGMESMQRERRREGSMAKGKEKKGKDGEGRRGKDGDGREEEREGWRREARERKKAGVWGSGMAQFQHIVLSFLPLLVSPLLLLFLLSPLLLPSSAFSSPFLTFFPSPSPPLPSFLLLFPIRGAAPPSSLAVARLLAQSFMILVRDTNREAESDVQTDTDGWTIDKHSKRQRDG